MADFIFNSKRGFKVKGIGGIFLNDRNRESSENKEFLRRKTIKGEKFPRDGKTPRGSEFLGSEEIVKNKELMSINDKEFLGNKWSFNFLKKLTALFLSFTIIYSQFFFTILLSQITINSIIKITSDSDNPYQLSLLTSEAHASSLDSNIPHSIQNPMNNIVDNPIPYIEIDNSIGKGETGLDRSQNGTPIIHINNPNDSGISANYYKDFNVTNENLIFNNHQGEAVSTNLGGVIYGNPNFKNPNGKEADIILNEITANRQTKIEGYMEIAGKKADLIIANPNGIMVSGGGFLNTSRLALITGSSLNGNNCDPSTNPSSCSSFDLNNNLNPFQLSTNPNATITIVGRNITDNQGRSVAYNLGIDASNQDYLALISRVVQINGDIIGNLNTNLEIKTGNNKASYNKDIKEFEVDSDDSKEQLKPEFAIDSTALGGIYAGRISIIATEEGVGTRIRSDVVANVEDIDFDVNGNIILNESNIQTLNQEKTIKIQNKNKQNNNNETSNINNQNQEYKLELSKSHLNAGNIEIETDNLINKDNSTVYANNSVDIDINSLTNNNNSTIYANNLTINTTDIDNTDGKLLSANNLTINQNNNFITQGIINSFNGITTINANNIHIDNNNTDTILSGYNICLNAKEDITNKDNSTLTASNNIIINALNVYNGTVENKNTSNATISAGNNLTIEAENRIINYGFLQAIGSAGDGNLTLITKSELNDNYRLNNITEETTKITEDGSLAKEYLNNLRINETDETLTEQTGIHNYGRLYSNNDMTLISNSVLHNNQNSLIYSNNNLNFYVNNILFNNAGGSLYNSETNTLQSQIGTGIYSNNNITVQSNEYNSNTQTYNRLNQLINYDGKIEANNDIDIRTDELVNYGSDNYNLSDVNNEINKIAYKYSNVGPQMIVDNSLLPEGIYTITSNYFGEKDACFDCKYKEYEEFVSSNLASNMSIIRSNNSLRICTQSSDMNNDNSDNNTLDTNNLVLNKNSSIQSKNVEIETGSLINYISNFIVTTLERYNERGYLCGGKCNRDTFYYTNNVLYSSTPSEIIASDTLNIKSQNIQNGGLMTKKDVEKIEGQNLSFGNSNDDNNNQNNDNPNILNPLDNIQLPTNNYGLYRQTTNPDSHYLFETDPLLTNISAFIGSRYFLERLGINLDTLEQKFLGDAQMEYEMLRKSLEQVSYFQHAYLSDEEMKGFITNLYQSSSIELQNELGLEFGKAPTEEQIAMLQEDILWYVEQEITLSNGDTMTALVPQIFFAQSTIDNINNFNTNNTGAMIAGNNINIETDNITNTNNSSIIANNNLTIVATEDINNLNGGIITNLPYTPDPNSSSQYEKVLYLFAGNDINNIGGNISSSNDMMLIANNDINNETLIQRTYTGINGSSANMSFYDNILSTANIESNGNITMISNNDINISGNISSNDNLSMEADNNINIKSIILETFYETKGASGGDEYHRIEQTLTNTASNITLNNGQIDLKANNDINIQGSNLQSEEGINLIADNNVNITTSLDKSYHYLYSKEEDWTGAGSIDINETLSLTNNSSNLMTNGNLNIIAGNNINSISSNLMSTGDINLLAGYELNEQNQLTKTDNQGNINLLQSQDLNKTYAYHEEWDGFLAALNPANWNVSFDSMTGAISEISVSSQELTDENTTITKTANVNNIQSNGNINLHSTGIEGNILSQGTQLYAENDINFSANNITLLSADNNQTTESKHDETTVTTGVKIGNAYVDAYNAGDAVTKAGEQVHYAEEELDKMKELYKQGKASKEAVEDAKINLAMATVNLINANIAFAASVAGAATAASSSFGTGFYASGFVNYDTNSTTATSESNWQTQSNMQSGSGNITFTTSNNCDSSTQSCSGNMLQEGTNLYALNNEGTGTITYDIANDLTIKASEDTYKSDMKSEHLSAGVSVGNNAVQVNLGAGESSSKVRATTYNNSDVYADNINITTGNNTTIQGANIEATNNLDLNIGNNLTVESLQDTYYEKSNSWDASLGIGTGSVGGGFNVSKGNTDSQWVNEQTTLTGNSVNINTTNNTDITGAVIASNMDNLTINTGSLTYSDLNDFYTSENKGFGLSTTIGTTTNQGETNSAPKGSTTVTLKSTGEEKEQITRATIGEGNIIIGGQNIEDITDSNGNNLYADLNRDVNNPQEITKDMITGALDGSMTIDNRILSSITGDTSGLQSITNDFSNLGTNLVKATAGAVSTAISPIVAVYDSITADKNDPNNNENTNNDSRNIIDVWKANQSANATGILRGGNQDVSDIVTKIKEGTATPEEIQRLSNMVSEGKGNLVYSKDGELVNKDTNEVVLGFNDQDNKQGYVNLANGSGTNALQYYLTDAEERAHNYTGNEDIAKGSAKSELTYYNVVSWLTGGTTITEGNSNTGGYGTQTQSEWNSTYNTNTSQLLKDNTEKANTVNNDSKAYDVAYQLKIGGEMTGEYGHMSGYFQDSNGNWYKFDQGMDIGQTPNPSALGILTNQAYPAGISIQEVTGDVENYLKNDSNTVYIKITKEQDEKIYNEANKNKDNPKDYRLCTNNCVDAVNDIFEAGGVNTPLKIDPRPNKYFEKLQKMYPNNDTNNAIRR